MACEPLPSLGDDPVHASGSSEAEERAEAAPLQKAQSGHWPEGECRCPSAPLSARPRFLLPPATASRLSRLRKHHLPCSHGVSGSASPVFRLRLQHFTSPAHHTWASPAASPGPLWSPPPESPGPFLTSSSTASHLVVRDVGTHSVGTGPPVLNAMWPLCHRGDRRFLQRVFPRTPVQGPVWLSQWEGCRRHLLSWWRPGRPLRVLQCMGQPQRPPGHSAEAEKACHAGTWMSLLFAFCLECRMGRGAFM